MQTETIQTAMSEVLGALGFKTMAREVLTETDGERLRIYARVAVKNSPESKRQRMTQLLRSAGLIY